MRSTKTSFFCLRAENGDFQFKHSFSFFILLIYGLNFVLNIHAECTFLNVLLQMFTLIGIVVGQPAAYLKDMQAERGKCTIILIAIVRVINIELHAMAMNQCLMSAESKKKMCKPIAGTRQSL